MADFLYDASFFIAAAAAVAIAWQAFTSDGSQTPDRDSDLVDPYDNVGSSDADHDADDD